MARHDSDVRFFLQADSMLARKPSGAKPPVWWIPMLLLRMERIEVVAHIVAKGRANASDDDWRPSRARDGLANSSDSYLPVQIVRTLVSQRGHVGLGPAVPTVRTGMREAGTSNLG